MNKIESVCVHGKHGEWVLKNQLDYSNEELDIIINAAVKAKAYNRRYYEREKELARAKAEKRANRRGLADTIKAFMFRDPEADENAV